ncbi:MAG TPA: putative cytokinetic ring protein SteA [Gaiellaceae bacterium]|nr:putative cytokinetic ring protein SteA [Gaiellaceae bacterium]
MPTRARPKRTRRAPVAVELTGRARLDRRTKRLVHRLSAGDVAIIDHTDLDRVSAEELVESGVRVVVNVAHSTSGRYPNLGPLTLVRGGVRLVDAPGAALFDRLTEGEWVTVRGGSVFRNGDRLATGRVVDELELLHALDEQQARLADAISRFADNTMRYLRDEGRLLAEGIDFPTLATRFRDRHVLVVARGPGHKHDLRIVRGYIRNFKPVLVGVDGGADALREAGYKPDVIVGDMDSVTDETLACGAELVVHAYPGTGDAPGAARAERLGLPYHAVPAPGISEDVALLLAYDKGAELIVAVGTHFNLVEFLERSREGMSSTFMARLRVGEILVDAKGVSRLVSGRVGVWPLVAFAGAGFAAIVVAILASPDLRSFIQLLGERLLTILGLG